MTKHKSLCALVRGDLTKHIRALIFRKILLWFTFSICIIYVYQMNKDIIISEKTQNQAASPRDTQKDLKYLLIWTPDDIAPSNYLGKGQTNFIKNKCEFTTCFVTSNRTLLGGDVTNFDAIIFNGRNLRPTNLSELPQQRSPHQKYIFVNLEPVPYEPACDPWYDGFFNWTCTYKLNSDIVYSYVYIRDLDGKPVGPKADIKWASDMKEIDQEFKEKLKSKKKAAAWFVSRCSSKSRREAYVKHLSKALNSYGLKLDEYGKCRSALDCPYSQKNHCDALVESDYYFYLSFENSFAEDYVTEKLLTALNNAAVPVVFGGANYSRFLPPGSYLNAREHDPKKLAAIMADVINTPSKYHDFFRWRNHYTYSESELVEDVCNVCAALNDRDKVLTQSAYEHFRSWWDPDWKKRCK